MDTSKIPYRLEDSRAQRLLVLLEELNLKYEIKTYKRNKDRLAPESLKKIHPLGKSPAVEIELPGQAPFVLAESGAIFEYLCTHFGKHLIPARGGEGGNGIESEEFRRNRYFMHYAEGSLMSLVAIAAVMSSIKEAPLPFFIKPITRMITSKVDEVFLTPNFETHFEFLEGQLETSPHGGSYLCGKDIMEADFLMMFPVESCKSMAALTPGKFPLLCGYLDLMKRRESCKAAERRLVGI
ncbi:Glutathione S-transferase [Lachnellula occidentalis]|uniref:Glutathione S-transferase n=1 Tax=Lachnellula occidentalis TaxID=215460 RepID=A0A8H8UKK1_9HELO|nr:Glutathione S-transferase [Lachnellula occidentalis]